MHSINRVIEKTKAEHAFLAAVHSVYGAIKIARDVRTNAVDVGSIE